MKCLVIDYIDEEVFREFKKYMDVDLISGQLGGYAADVMEQELAGQRAAMSSPLIGCDRFIVSPHSGGQTRDSVYKISRFIFDKCNEALHFT